MTNSKTIAGISLAVLFTMSMVFTPAFATGHLTLKDGTSATIQQKGNNIELAASFKTITAIPTDGDSGAFGYAVLTDGGSGPLDNVVVLVTHLPIDDSTHEELPSGLHTHVLDLMTPSESCTGHSLEVDLAGSVANSAFDADYTWNIKDNTAKIKKVPVGDLGNPDNVALIAAFTVTPVFAGDNLTNLCVDVTSTIS